MKENLSKLLKSNLELSEMIMGKEEIIRNNYEILREQFYISNQSRIDEIEAASKEFINEIDECEKKNLEFI